MMHRYGTTDFSEISDKDEAANYGEQSGITGAPRVTLTGQDLMQDYQRQYQTFKKQNPKAGATFSDFLKKNNLMDTYEEAQSFVRSGAEDPKTLNREDLADAGGPKMQSPMKVAGGVYLPGEGTDYYGEQVGKEDQAKYEENQKRLDAEYKS